MLAEPEGLVVSRSTGHRAPGTGRRVLLAAGGTRARPRRRPVRRARRERLAPAGMRVQAAGRRQHWFGPDQPAVTLLARIDDATRRGLGAVFRAQEDGVGARLVVAPIGRTHGIPVARSVDRHGSVQPHQRPPLPIAAALAGGRAPTRVGRVLGAVGIGHRAARRPRAKGRVERLGGTWPDRRGAELAAAGVTTMAAATAVLPRALDRHTARCAVPPTDAGRASRPVPTARNLAQVCCCKHTRVVRPAHTISFQGAPIHRRPTAARRGWVKARVAVHARLDGSRARV